MATSTITGSGWIAAIDYQPVGDGRGRLTVTKHDGGAIVHENVPSWVPGLIAAAKSAGRAYNLLVRERGYRHVATVLPVSKAPAGGATVPRDDAHLAELLRASLSI